MRLLLFITKVNESSKLKRSKSAKEAELPIQYSSLTKLTKRQRSKLVQQKLDKFGMALSTPTEGDGNCLIHALKDQMG